MGMIEEGLSGEYKMTMQRDRRGTMDTDQRRKNDEHPEAREKRSFYVGESTLHGEFHLQSTERRRGILATPPPEGLPGVPEGALIRLDREVYGLVSGMSGWRSRSFPT